MNKLTTKIHNFFFCLKYPFWRATNVWTGKYVEYDFTWYDDIPEGWQKAFGKELSEEIRKAGKEYLKSHKDQKWEDILHWQQIKEKYGTLRLYASTIDTIQDILDKYECLSMGYCIECGKPAKYITMGWVEFLCEDHVANCDKNHIRRLEEDDIPVFTKYNYKPIKEEFFDNEASCDESLNKLYDKEKHRKNARSNILYYKKVFNEEHNKWSIVISTLENIVSNPKEKYGIDFKKLWGLNK